MHKDHTIASVTRQYNLVAVKAGRQTGTSHSAMMQCSLVLKLWLLPA